VTRKGKEIEARIGKKKKEERGGTTVEEGKKKGTYLSSKNSLITVNPARGKKEEWPLSFPEKGQQQGLARTLRKTQTPRSLGEEKNLILFVWGGERKRHVLLPEACIGGGGD